jgi:hypothetical protein
MVRDLLPIGYTAALISLMPTTSPRSVVPGARTRAKTPPHTSAGATERSWPMRIAKNKKGLPDVW